MPRRILIVRPSALGDVSRSVPVLATLRRAYPDARIDWLVAKTFADAIRHHPMLDGVFAFDRTWFRRLIRGRGTLSGGLGWVRELRQTRYDAVYDLQGLARSGLFAFLSGAARRVGFAGAREGAWLGYSVRHRIDPSIRHTVDRMLALLEADGLEPVRDMRLYLGEDDRNFLAAFREHHHIERGYACLAPTAQWGSKCWPLEKYADFAARLLETGVAGERLVVLSSPSEWERVTGLAERLPEALRPRVIFPTTTVGQMMALLSGCELLVANDSAPLHIAVGFDRPVVAIFGPTDPAEVGPYQREDAVVRPKEAAHQQISYRAHRDDSSLIAKVSVDEVWEKVVRCA